ncbi:hypothetical protein TNCT_483131 [Trichonephila clavata]|uniref:Uncharacterized protein n=1 Tax=Trichonephila clavata TaxID=2740835 RepID=A0A8X6L2J9_TRICU|nr:hypothetical protein TNCT_483131 [Trichonephila clavata]
MNSQNACWNSATNARKLGAFLKKEERNAEERVSYCASTQGRLILGCCFGDVTGTLSGRWGHSSFLRWGSDSVVSGRLQSMGRVHGVGTIYFLLSPKRKQTRACEKESRELK